MKAIVLTATGGPDVLELQDVPDPTPGPGEVVVDNAAIPVLFVETQLRAGLFPGVTTPAVFGSQAAGVIGAVGTDVDPALRGARVLVSGQALGTYAEKVCAPASSVAILPDGVSFVDAAAMTMGVSVALTLANRAALRESDTVLIEAAGTGIGNYLTQRARRFGVRRIIATAGSEANRESALRAGADDVIDHRSGEWLDDLANVLGDATVDVVFDSIGGDSTRRLLDSVTPLTGRILFYGLLSGRPPQVTAAELMGSGISLAACAGPAWLETVAAARRDALDAISAGVFTPSIDSVLPLAAAAEAHRRIESRTATGTFVLRP